MTVPIGASVREPGCEAVADGPLHEPVAALTSLAFVVAGLLIARGSRRARAAPPDEWRRRVPSPTLVLAGLVAAVGVGSVIDHGPDPAWSDVVHDVPLLATVAYVAADAAADLTGRRAVRWWWVPVLVLLPLLVLAPRPGDLAQAGVAGVAVVLTVARAAARPPLRPRIAAALALLAVGAVTGTLSRAGGPWCDPASPWQGHGGWHLLAAAALVVLAPTVGHRRESPSRPGQGAR